MKLVAFYGTLMRTFEVQRRLGLAPELRFVSNCRIPGRLYDLGDYPGLVEADGEVRGEVFELLGPRTLEKLDEFEEYDPARPDDSEYLRRPARLIDPDLEAWVYVYNRPVAGRRWIQSGRWSFTRRRAGAILARVNAAEERSSSDRPTESPTR